MKKILKRIPQIYSVTVLTALVSCGGDITGNPQTLGDPSDEATEETQNSGIQREKSPKISPQVEQNKPNIDPKLEKSPQANQAGNCGNIKLPFNIPGFRQATPESKTSSSSQQSNQGSSQSYAQSNPNSAAACASSTGNGSAWGSAQSGGQQSGSANTGAK